MNAEQLKIYKREKSRQFNANLKALRLKDKAKKQKRTSDTDSDDEVLERPDKQGNYQATDQVTDQGDPMLVDLFFKIEELETKINELLKGVVGGRNPLLDEMLDEILNKLDIMETIIETKLETKLETRQPLKPFERQPFQLQHSVFA